MVSILWAHWWKNRTDFGGRLLIRKDKNCTAIVYIYSPFFEHFILSCI